MRPMNDSISQAEQSRRSLQDTIESAKRAIEQTLDLIERTRALRSQTTAGPAHKLGTSGVGLDTHTHRSEAA